MKEIAKSRNVYKYNPISRNCLDLLSLLFFVKNLEDEVSEKMFLKKCGKIFIRIKIFEVMQINHSLS